MAIFRDFRRFWAENGYFWAKNPKYQKSGNVRPSGFLRHYLGQKIRRKYQFWKKLFKKLSFENGRFSLILARFWAKSPKTCQLRRPISRKRLNIFWFCKKFLAPHNQEYKICQNKENLRFLLRHPPPIALTGMWATNNELLQEFIIEQDRKCLARKLPTYILQICQKSDGETDW